MKGLTVGSPAKRPISAPLSSHIVNDSFEVSYALIFLADGFLHGPLILNKLFLMLFLKGFLFLVKMLPKVFVLLL